MFIYVVFNSAFSAKYHARNLHFKVWYVRINTLNKGDLACPVQPGATCATTNIEHKISRNGVGKMFLSTWCSYWLFHSLLPMFLDSAETCLEMKYEALSSWGRRRSEVGLSMGPRCLSFREGLAAVVQLNLYTCCHYYFATEWRKLSGAHFQLYTNCPGILSRPKRQFSPCHGSLESRACFHHSSLHLVCRALVTRLNSLYYFSVFFKSSGADFRVSKAPCREQIRLGCAYDWVNKFGLLEGCFDSSPGDFESVRRILWVRQATVV